MKRLPFSQVDVFTREVLTGNPLAVFREADGVSEATMQRIAREMNLSETTFVLPSTRDDCDYRVRIFMPNQELPFAGHPTLGTAFVLHRLGLLKTDAFAFEMKIGRVPVRRDANTGAFWMTPPVPKVNASFPELNGYLIGNGVSFLCMIMPTWESVDEVNVDRTALAKICGAQAAQGDLLYIAFDQQNQRAYSRMFAHQSSGIDEDPATGSSVAPLCLALQSAGLLGGEFAIQIEQGVKMGRRSVLFAQQKGGVLEVGGHAVCVFESILELPDTI